MYIKSPNYGEGYTPIVNKDNSDLKHIEMGYLASLKAGDEYEMTLEGKEAGINIAFGSADMDVVLADGTRNSYERLGERRNRFDGAPCMIYLPAGAHVKFRIVRAPFEALVYQASSTRQTSPYIVRPEDVLTQRTGQLNWMRYVRYVIQENVDAERIVLGETVVPSGHWTSYPPHKHDENDPPFEKKAEELYLFRFDKPDGFAIIRINSDPGIKDEFDDAFVVKDGDFITVPRGYHSIAVAPGYKMIYYFCLSGDERNWNCFKDDKRYQWIKNCDAIINEAQGRE